MELRDLGEIDFYSIFSLLCRSESKMFRAHFPLHIPCIFSYPCVELFKIHPMSFLFSYILSFALSARMPVWDRPKMLLLPAI